MSDIKIITTKELQNRLQQNDNLEFWNVLTDEYFKGEFIPGSRRVPLDKIGREVTRTSLPKDAEIITYCSGFSCPQSKAAAEKLIALGYTNVKAYEGGLEEWQNSGFEVQKAQTA